MDNALQIISCGEALIDFKQMESLNFEGFEGGSPMNVAVAAARLGPKVGFAGQVSNDLFGEVLRKYLEKNKVDMTYLLEHHAPSTLAFVAEIDGDAHFSFMSSGAADTLYDPRPRPSFPESLKYLMFGSISLLTEPTASSILDVVALHEERCTIVLDPNVRPTLIPDKDEYETKLSRWLELADIVKVSTQDLTWLYPDSTKEEVASRWLEQGPGAVIITDGGDGVTLYRPGKEPLIAASKKVEVVDTVGAGDTFTGGLMTRLLELDKSLSALTDESWLDVLSFAAHAAAFNCTRAGANPPTRDELNKFMEG